MCVCVCETHKLIGANGRLLIDDIVASSFPFILFMKTNAPMRRDSETKTNVLVFEIYFLFKIYFAIHITLTHQKYAVTNNVQSDAAENHQFLR